MVFHPCWCQPREIDSHLEHTPRGSPAEGVRGDHELLGKEEVIALYEMDVQFAQLPVDEAQPYVHQAPGRSEFLSHPERHGNAVV